MTMGDRIYNLRKKLDLTQGDIARACKVSTTTVHKWEHGVIDNMRADKVQRLAEVLGTTIDYLLDGVLEPTLYKNIEPMPQTKTGPILGDIACGEPVLAQENYEGLAVVGGRVHADFALHHFDRWSNPCGSPAIRVRPAFEFNSKILNNETTKSTNFPI